MTGGHDELELDEQPILGRDRSRKAEAPSRRSTTCSVGRALHRAQLGDRPVPAGTSGPLREEAAQGADGRTWKREARSAAVRARGGGDSPRFNLP